MIIAEVGQNHCGNMNLAKALIAQAKHCGADLVKFQLYDHKKLYGGNGDIPNVELNYKQAKSLFRHGVVIGIEVFFSVFDIERIRWCEDIGVRRYKIGYRHRNNRALVNAVKGTNKPVIISSNKPEFGDTLYCVPKYPTYIEDINWDMVRICGGFSDHTVGIDAAKKAKEYGAGIIEKHFAINHEKGVDAPWSMTPSELRELKRWENVCKEVV